MYIPQRKSAVARTEPSSQQTEASQEKEKKETEEGPKQFISTPLSMSFSLQKKQKTNGNTSGNALGKAAEKPKASSLSLFFS